jgi:tRNA (guanine37-N1)-methyltransferase
MHISFISIFPEVYTSFLETSLIKKAQEKTILTFDIINPRDFCADKHQQIDDIIYGGWAGMLMKAQPMIDAIEAAIDNTVKLSMERSVSRKIIFLSPSPMIFNQQQAYEYSKLDHIIFVSWRYEWIDYRFEQYIQKKYPDNFIKLSLWQFVTLWWELPSMVVVESIVRLIPWVIKEEASHLIESYDPTQSMQNLEYPQYTRPEEVEWMKVPDVLLSGHHAEIQKRRDKNTL